MNALIRTLLLNHWKLSPPNPDTNEFLGTRWGQIPSELNEFIHSYSSLCNQEENQWFLSSIDYQKNTSEGFNWNEFELMSLQAAADDEEWQKSIQTFWSNHLPIFMRVDGSYQYVAYCFDGKHKGAYVSGEEPEFEETSIVAYSLSDLTSWLKQELALK